MKLWSLPIKAFVVALAVVAGASAQTADKPVKAPSTDAGRSCFRNADVTSWADVDKTTINLRVGVRDYYQVKLIGPCGDIDWDLKIALRSRGSSFICSGFDADVIASSPLGPLTCPASSVRRLTADEVKALPSRQKP
jgi:hypothetical protein